MISISAGCGSWPKHGRRIVLNAQLGMLSGILSPNQLKGTGFLCTLCVSAVNVSCSFS